MIDDRELNIGDEVLILSDDINSEFFDEHSYIKGIVSNYRIIETKKGCDRIYREYFYEVLGDDGNVYEGFCGSEYSYDTIYFLTKKEFIELIKFSIDDVSREIKERMEKLRSLKEVVKSLRINEKQKVLSKTL